MNITTQEFLDLFGEEHQFVLISPKKTETLYGRYDRLEAALYRYNQQGYGVYFTVHEMSKGTQRTKNKLKRLRALWVEDDGDKHGVTDPDKFPVKPNVVVQSSPGKYHYYWLTSTTGVDEWEELMAGMCKEYHGDPAGTLLTQVLRVPGFENNKYQENPVVEVVAYHGNNPLPWPKAMELFPKGTPREVKAKPSPDSPDSKFSVKEAIDDILSGETVHESRIRLAMHWANSGMPREDALAALNSYVEDAIRNGTVASGRALERIGNMRQAVDSAYDKVESEAAPKFSGDIIPEVDVYTRLPEVQGALKTIVNSVMEYMPYPSYEMALVVAQHAISVFGGGLYHVRNKTCTRKRTILADTGRGKSIVDKYYNELVRRMAVQDSNINPYMFNGNNSYAVNNMHLELIEHRVRSYIMSEAGLMGKTTAGTTTETRAYILNAISSSRKSAINAKLLSARTQENRKVNEALKTVYGIVPVFLSESVPAQYIDVLANSDAFRSGDIGREELIFVDPHKPPENFLCEGDIPEDIVNTMALLARTFEALDTAPGDNPNNPDYFTEAEFGPGVGDAFNTLCQENTRAQNLAAKNSDYVQQAMLSRVPEKVMVTMLVQAIADLAFAHRDEPSLLSSPPLITMTHFQFAVDYHNELNRSLIAQTQSGNMADPLTLCIDRLVARCRDFGGHSGDRKYSIDYRKRHISRAWITDVLNRSKFKPMDTLINNNHGDRDRAMRAILSYAEDINLLSPVNTSQTGKKQLWRINT